MEEKIQNKSEEQEKQIQIKIYFRIKYIPKITKNIKIIAPPV